MLELTSRADLTLDLVHRVAWRGEPIALTQRAKARIAERRGVFERLLQDPSQGVYGVNQGQGEMIHHALDAAQVARLAQLKPFPAAVSFGDDFPPRVVRAMVLARFANILDGHAAATPRLADALIDMLNADAVPRVAYTGQGGAGEILATYPLFAALSERFDLQPGERGALINGAPCAGALLADVALASRRRLDLVQQVLALAVVAFGAPREHYDPALGALWGGAHHRAAFEALDALLGPAEAPVRSHQAPVSYRIVPALLAQAHWAVSQAEETAITALGAVTHNPTYLEPDAVHPLGRCVSTGGFHNALAAPVIDNVTGVWADLCLLAGRLSAGLLNGRVSGFSDFLLGDRDPSESDGHGALGYLPMAIAGFVEEARALAQRSFIPAVDASVFGQDDVAAPVFLAWPKAAKAGETLDRALAVLSVVASQALHLTARDPQSGPLRNLLGKVRETVPVVTADRILGPELQALSAYFNVSIFGTNLRI
ncbi:aromatic amino acid lyase [Dongia sedimenti]|uniref:Aromatic amino acid lyase n=1 Tax=Dongia sedimenti TaxID=3064282 RepID=A0ABU0YKD0_9PROT|nr:aromatic amino acid lyase [Rhodospirillaceae bacterium R-7]